MPIALNRQKIVNTQLSNTTQLTNLKLIILTVVLQQLVRLVFSPVASSMKLDLKAWRLQQIKQKQHFILHRLQRDWLFTSSLSQCPIKWNNNVCKILSTPSTQQIHKIETNINAIRVKCYTYLLLHTVNLSFTNHKSRGHILFQNRYHPKVQATLFCRACYKAMEFSSASTKRL